MFSDYSDTDDPYETAIAFTEDVLNRNGRVVHPDGWAVTQVMLFARQSERALDGRDFTTAYDAFTWWHAEYGDVTPEPLPAPQRRRRGIRLSWRGTRRQRSQDGR